MPITQFGIISVGTQEGNFTPDVKVIIAKSLGVSFARSSILINNFRPQDKTIQAYKNAQLKQLINFNTGPASMDPDQQSKQRAYPLTSPSFCNYVNNAADVLNPDILGIISENEPLNETYFYPGKETGYILELQTVSTIAALKLKFCADGGLPTPRVLQLINSKKPVPNPSKIFALAGVIDAIQYMPVTHINIHFNTTNMNVYDNSLNDVVSFLTEQTGLPVMCNEFSIHENNPALVTQCVKKLKECNVTHAVIFNGQKKIDKALAIADLQGKLNYLGIAYRDAIQ